MTIFIYSILFFLSIFCAFFLLENSLSFYHFVIRYKKQIGLSFLVVFFIKGIFFCDYKNVLGSNFFVKKDIWLDFAFMISVLTDLIDESVFVVVPLSILGITFLSFIYNQEYFLLFDSVSNIVIILLLYYFIDIIFTKFFAKKGMGFGDILLYLLLSCYYDLFFLIISFWISCVLGLFVIIIYKMIFFKKPLLKRVPFVPFVFLGVELLSIPSVKNTIYNFLF